jgi:hypothetical protein
MSTPNENLAPVGRLATERAFNRVIGGPVTDTAKYHKYIRQVDRRQGEFWGAVQMLGKSHERARRIIGSDTPLQLNSYIGGALIYLASREEQAKLDRTTVPPLLVGEVGNAALKTLTLGDASPDDLRDLVTGFEREMSDVDLGRIADSSLRDALEVNDGIFRDYRASFESSPFAGDLEATITNIARIMEMSAVMRVAAFPDREAEFCETMTRYWWHRTPAPVTHGQIMGAADARALVSLSV